MPTREGAKRTRDPRGRPRPLAEGAYMGEPPMRQPPFCNLVAAQRRTGTERRNGVRASPRDRNCTAEFKGAKACFGLVLSGALRRFGCKRALLRLRPRSAPSGI